MKNILISIGLLTIICNTQAQNAYEALRYSQTHAGGTARGLGVGGAFGALGADLTSTGLNPGGLGMYRRSEATLSLNLNAINSTSNFNNNADQIKLNFNSPNFGIVLNRTYEDSRGNRSRGKWVGMNFAFGITRYANFNSKRFYKNETDAVSILPELANELNGINPSAIEYGSASFESVLAYAGYIINPANDDSLRYEAVTSGEKIGKEISTNTQGKIDEMAFAIAANYDNKIYFGATLGIPLITYTETMLYSEYDIDNTINGFNNFELEKRIRTSGGGVNLKVGAVYSVTDWLRLGTALHTPSYVRLNDKYSSNIVSNIDTISYESASPDGSFKYKMLTPWKGIGSVAFIVKQYGFISFDYEYSDFRNNRYLFENNFQSFENNLNKNIDNTLNISHTLRAGAEGVIKNFRIRGGYNISTNPFNKAYQAFNNRHLQSFSGGVGYRGEQFNIDFAYVRSINDSPLLLADNVVTSDKITRSNFIVTFGLRF